MNIVNFIRIVALGGNRLGWDACLAHTQDKYMKYTNDNVKKHST